MDPKPRNRQGYYLYKERDVRIILKYHVHSNIYVRNILQL